MVRTNCMSLGLVRLIENCTKRQLSLINEIASEH